MKISHTLEKRIKELPFASWVVDIGRHIRHPLEQEEVWRDYFKTYEDTGFIRDHQFHGNPQEIVLFVPASGMVYEAKLFSMLALGLRMQGYRPVVLLSRSYTWSKRYFRAFGVDEFVFWEDVKLPKKEQEECESRSAGFRELPLTFQSVKQWKYRGAFIGPQIISTVCRGVMEGAPDLSDSLIQKKLFSLLPSTLKTVHRANHVFDRTKPKMMVLIEANYAMMGALVDAAIQRDVNVIQITQPARDDAFIMKRLTKETRRHHPFSVSRSTMKQFEKFPWSKNHEHELMVEFQNRYGGKWFLQNRNQPGVVAKSREDIQRQLNLDPTKKTAIVFSHILWDANLFYGEDLFEDYGDWFVQTVKAACENPRVNWVIKLHPANLWKRAREGVTGRYSEEQLISDHIGTLPEHVKLLYPNTDISTWSLFEFADYGVTVRGTIGMEMPCLGVPVFTAGTGRYSSLGFTIDSKLKEEYLDKLGRIQEFGRMKDEQTLLAKKHAYIAFRLRPWLMKSFKVLFNCKKKGIHPLDNNLSLTASSFDEIEKNGDLKKWAKWADEERSVDYLDIPEKL